MNDKDLDTILENVWHDGQGHTAKGLVAAVDEAKLALQADLLAIVSSFEVETLPSDDPKLIFWQGYHQAQLDISQAITTYCGGES